MSFVKKYVYNIFRVSEGGFVVIRYMNMIIWLMLSIWLVLFVVIPVKADSRHNIVTFDYAIADTLDALQHPPIALGGLAQYRQLYQEKLLPETHDLGLRFQPNFEYLSLFEPDAILISPPAHLNIQNKLLNIAHVEKIQLLWSKLNVWPSLDHLTREIGKVIDDEQQAQVFIDTVEVSLSDMAAKIERPAEPLLIVEIRDGRHVRVYGPGSLEDAVLTRLGLENAWQGSTNGWGFSTLSILEAFRLEGQKVVLHPFYAQEQDSTSTLPASGLWQHWLDDTSLSINRNYWPWGGFPSALRFAESLVEALEAQALVEAAG